MVAERSLLPQAPSELADSGVAIVTDPVASARVAGLRYAPDSTPGVRRRKKGKGFSYVDPAGAVVRDVETLRRIRSLAIPPAWTDVWISTHPNGHIQATGRDAKGRKQYRYHPQWRATRDATKYHRMIGFAAALPRIRARVESDLAQAGLPREKVLATVVRLLETTLIRIGNEEYTRKNHSFGLTTLRDQHVEVQGAKVAFRFHGKSGVARAVELNDRRIAAIVRRCQELPGHELFQYVRSDGETAGIESGDVNEYLRDTTGEDFTAKDFRTWAGTVLAALRLNELGAAHAAKGGRPLSERAKAALVREAVRNVSKRLGNTPAVCRNCYVHPAVVDGFRDGHLLEVLARPRRAASRSAHALRAEETAVVSFLEERFARESQVRRGLVPVPDESRRSRKPTRRTPQRVRMPCASRYRPTSPGAPEPRKIAPM